MDYFYPCLVFLWILYLFDEYLSGRQHKLVCRTERLPKELDGVFDDETYEKTRKYQIDKHKFAFWSGLFNQLHFTVIMMAGLIPLTWDSAGGILSSVGLDQTYQITQSVVFLIIAQTYQDVIALPFVVYQIFWLEEKHGFNNQTVKFFIKDQLKGVVVKFILMSLIASGMIFFIDWGGDYFFVYTWLFLFVIIIVMMTIYPVLIAPLFDTYTLLPEGPLRTAIEELASSLQYPLKKIFFVDGSNRSSHSNAYMYGFYKNKRIVLFDTLIEPGVVPEVDLQRKEKQEEKGKSPPVNTGSGTEDTSEKGKSPPEDTGSGTEDAPEKGKSPPEDTGSGTEDAPEKGKSPPEDTGSGTEDAPEKGKSPPEDTGSGTEDAPEKGKSPPEDTGSGTEDAPEKGKSPPEDTGSGTEDAPEKGKSPPEDTGSGTEDAPEKGKSPPEDTGSGTEDAPEKGKSPPEDTGSGTEDAPEKGKSPPEDTGSGTKDASEKKKPPKGCNKEEIIAVLAHELGHWKYSHVVKHLIFLQVDLLISLYLFSFFFKQQDIYDSFGFYGIQPIIIGLIIVFQLLFSPIHTVMGFCMIQMSRRFEYQADAFAVEMEKGNLLQSALTKLFRDNLGFPLADPLYSAFNHSHPTFLERVKAIRSGLKKKN